MNDKELRAFIAEFCISPKRFIIRYTDNMNTSPKGGKYLNYQTEIQWVKPKWWQFLYKYRIKECEWYLTHLTPMDHKPQFSFQ